ncbi:MAG: hypothetical protein JWL75_418 [Parcubacteria group bacterium]|nr:hypothetical protein [Parcubacteria group bacterium]
MVRNILRTDVFRVLVEDPAIERIVLLVHPTKLEVYTKEFGGGKVVLDTYPSNLPSRYELGTWFLLRHAIHTKNVRAKINELLYTSKGTRSARFFKYIAALIAFYVTYLWPVDWLLRKVTRATHRSKLFAPLMKKYQPDLVFLPTIFAHNDIRLLKWCADHDVPTIGMIKSWDNLIGKDPLLVWPDRLIVHNELVRELAWSMHRFPYDRIFIGGIPQMDVYAQPATIPSRTELFEKYHLDQNKRLIMYTAVGRLISYHELEVITYLADVVHALAEPSQLLVRLHPAYPSDDASVEAIPGITVVRPGMAGAERNPLRFDFEFRDEEVRDLMGMLAHSDVIIQSGSTTAIDAACFDTPIISLGFDGYAKNVREEESASRLLKKDHFARIVATGGTRAVYTPAELEEALTAYLANPALDHAGREKIVSEQCYKLDGKSGERIGSYISSVISELT